MRLFLQSAMIFFGTLFAAALLALGEPTAGEAADRSYQVRPAGNVMPALISWHEPTAAALPAR